MEPDIRASSGPHHTVAHFGPFSKMDRFVIESPKLPRPIKGKVFLRKSLGFTGMEISLNKLAPGDSTPFAHKHGTHEEAYVFVKGRGQIQIDDQRIDVEEGTVVRMAPAAVRAWRNNSNEDLHYVVIQAIEKTFAPDERDGTILPNVAW